MELISWIAESLLYLVVLVIRCVRDFLDKLKSQVGISDSCVLRERLKDGSRKGRVANGRSLLFHVQQLKINNATMDFQSTVYNSQYKL